MKLQASCSLIHMLYQLSYTPPPPDLIHFLKYPPIITLSSYDIMNYSDPCPPVSWMRLVSPAPLPDPSLLTLTLQNVLQAPPNAKGLANRPRVPASKLCAILTKNRFVWLSHPSSFSLQANTAAPFCFENRVLHLEKPKAELAPPRGTSRVNYLSHKDPEVLSDISSL